MHTEKLLLMAYVTKKDQVCYIELGNFLVDVSEGDILLFNTVKDISPLYPLKPETTLIAACCKGHQKLSVNSHKMELAEGNVFICPPNLKVSGQECSSDFECKVVCISDHLVRGLLRDKMDLWHNSVYVNQVNIVPMSQSCKEDLNMYLSLIRSKMKKNYPSPPYIIVLALLRAMLLELCYVLESLGDVRHEQKLSQGKILFNRFLSLISNSQVKRQPISFYAGQLAITPKYLTMLCLKYSNKTASEWVAQYTVEEIRFFLKSTELSIKEISACMGFSNMSHFGSYVRKHLGMSPSEYRFSKKM